jgi:hypothetical protein
VDHRTGGFEEVVLNDEYVWEAYGIPMAALTRFPYPEYHTDRDDVALMSEERLEEAVAVLLAAIEPSSRRRWSTSASRATSASPTRATTSTSTRVRWRSATAPTRRGGACGC